MGDQQAPIGEVFYIEGASSYKYGSVPLNEVVIHYQFLRYLIVNCISLLFISLRLQKSTVNFYHISFIWTVSLKKK